MVPTSPPTVSPSGPPTISPTKNPTGSPTIVPTGSPTGTPTNQPTGSPTGSPTMSPTATETPTIGLRVVSVPAQPLSLQSVQGDAALTAILTTPAVPVTSVDVSALSIGEMNFTGRSGLPSVTLQVIGQPAAKSIAKGRSVGVPVAIDRHTVLANPSTVKASCMVMFAQRLSINVRQMTGFTITFSDGQVAGRRAVPLLDQASASFTVCAELDCPEDSDDDFPGWALAFCIVMPVLFVVAVVGAVVYCRDSSGGDKTQPSDCGSGNDPFGGDQQADAEQPAEAAG
eukprot:TRINITY_DN1953_c0_g3_i1.p2 TRINITY_DN1953_c0_g3~~TRINITY_DN1953_c0_g3_i1.p2  ORF type:complete len:285 (+),score=48.27 TRINITY_DN1953_c0_g3_i1:854-1708(+)